MVYMTILNNMIFFPAIIAGFLVEIFCNGLTFLATITSW
jgi:hypothetical protein